MTDKKAVRVSGGYAIKRKAQVEHQCYDCGCDILIGEEYHQLSPQHYHYGYYTKTICARCWKGRQLKV